MPSIESLCKLAAAVYQPADVEGKARWRAWRSTNPAMRWSASSSPGRTDIATITIEQEGTGALGYVQHERVACPLPTAGDIESRVAVLMAGMAAEKHVYGEHSTGKLLGSRFTGDRAGYELGRHLGNVVCGLRALTRASR